MPPTFAEIALGSFDGHHDFAGLRVRLVRYAPRTAFGLHAHETASITLIIRGSAGEDSPAQPSFVARSGECIVKPAGVHHANCFGDRPTLTLQIEVPQRRAAPHWRAAVARRGYSCFYEPGMTAPLLALARELLADGAAAAEGGDLLADALGGLAAPRAPRRPTWLRRAEREIAERLPAAVRVQDVAEVLRLHPAHLTRAFRAAHGCGIVEYVRRWRVRFALDLLGRPGATLPDVALAAGFCDQAHLTRAFRAVLGATPGGFRRLVE